MEIFLWLFRLFFNILFPPSVSFKNNSTQKKKKLIYQTLKEWVNECIKILIDVYLNWRNFFEEKQKMWGFEKRIKKKFSFFWRLNDFHFKSQKIDYCTTFNILEFGVKINWLLGLFYISEGSYQITTFFYKDFKVSYFASLLRFKICKSFQILSLISLDT